MPTPPSNANPEFSETQTPLYDNAGHQFVAMRAYNVGTDGTTNIVYGDPATGSGGGGGGGGAVTVADGADVTQGTTTDAAVVGDTAGTVSGKLRGLTKIWNDIWDSVNHRIKVDGSGVTQPVSGTITANAGAGNFTVAQATGTNMHTVVDSGAVTNTQPDATTTGTITAAQPSIGTPVANATVQLALGNGQSSWGAVISGTFSAGSTIVVDHSRDGGTTWVASSFKVSGGLQNTTVQSFTGGATTEINGNDAGESHIRIRCSAIAGGDSISVYIRAGYGIGGVGLLSSIPAGSNTIGGVNVVDSAGTNKLAVDGAGKIGINALPTVTETNSASIKTDLDTIVTNTTKIPASPAQEGGNLATIATNTTGIATAANQTTANTNTANTATGIGGVADTAYTSGSGSAIAVLKGLYTKLGSVVLAAGSALIGGVQLVDSGGTNKAAVDAAGNQIVKGNFVEQASLTAGSLNALLVPATDVSAYKWLSLHIGSNAYVGTLAFQGSNNNVDWASVNLSQTGSSNFPTSTPNANAIFSGPVVFRYFRVIMTAYTSGTAQGTLELYTTAAANNYAGIGANGSSVGQAGTWTVQPGNTQNTTPWLTAGPTANATQAAGGSTTVVKASAGYLWSAVVTATGTAELDIYDNASAASGTKLLAIPANAAVGSIYSFPGGGRASSGVTSGGVTNCPAVTFYYS